MPPVGLVASARGAAPSATISASLAPDRRPACPARLKLSNQYGNACAGLRLQRNHPCGTLFQTVLEVAVGITTKVGSGLPVCGNNPPSHIRSASARKVIVRLSSATL